jgi:phage tail-like protein
MPKARFFNVVMTILLGIFFIHSAVPAQESSPSPQGPTFKFRVRWDGRIIPGITKIGGLTRITEVVSGRSGGDPNELRKSPGLTVYEPIVLKRPRAFDKSFEQWANKVWNFGSGFGAEVSLRDFRKDIVIELINGSGQLAMAFKVYRCWPSRYSALSGLDADENAPAMECLTLAYEGWERDYSVVEPAGP